MKLILTITDRKHGLLSRALTSLYADLKRTGESGKASLVEELISEVTKQMPFQSKL